MFIFYFHEKQKSLFLVKKKYKNMLNLEGGFMVSTTDVVASVPFLNIVHIKIQNPIEIF